MSARQDDVSSAISFVNIVEQYPCLWNCSLKSYSRTDITSEAWKKIAEKIKDTEQNCRDRWKNIRTAFGRSMRPPKSGSGGKSKKPYYLATYLHFLRPYMKGASMSGNVLLKEEIDYDMQETSAHDEEGTLEDTPEVTPANETLLKLEEAEIHQDPTPSKRRRMSNEQSHSDKFITDEQQDGDWLFFRSLLQDFKKLNEKRKRYLKLKFATLLYEELDQAEAEE
ncbi:transcription factor Adf-1-like [Cimex lectularius]|uniref:Transcription factor Adf-1 n=1 Tax=Cimex lectularius TaxID=79782 RepID=A0A8I6R9W8_CIMLE|nr:transcription factor Adf-1-like [Cimex lectularius]